MSQRKRGLAQELLDHRQTHNPGPFLVLIREFLKANKDKFIRSDYIDVPDIWGLCVVRKDRDGTGWEALPIYHAVKDALRQEDDIVLTFDSYKFDQRTDPKAELKFTIG